MLRTFALTVSFVVIGAVPALAQTHPGSHDRMHPHDSTGHAPIDSAQHAAMHAALIGSWRGTFHSAQGNGGSMEMSIARDSARTVSLRMVSDLVVRAGNAKDLTMDGGKLRWTQQLAGAACRATATLTAATPVRPNAMDGKLACEQGEITFTLQKTSE